MLPRADLTLFATRCRTRELVGVQVYGHPWVTGEYWPMITPCFQVRAVDDAGNEHVGMPGDWQGFPILVPAALGRPAGVVVSDGGRVVSLTYRRTPYGQLRMDEFAGHLDPVYFEKFVYFSNVTEVEVAGTKALWIKGPHELMYVSRDGTPAMASARLTTGNTLIWGTRQVALRLEGNLGKTAALAIASSAH
jgi:hypothetical protein